MKTSLIYLALAGTLIFFAIRLFEPAAPDESVAIIVEDSGASVPESSRVSIPANEAEHSVSAAASSTQSHEAASIHIMAPESDSVDEYLADVATLPPASSNAQAQKEITPVFFDAEITLWQPVSSAKSVFENYGAVLSLSEEHFIEFDESLLETLEVGQRFTLPKLGESRQQVIVMQQEYWEHGATNWVFVDSNGKPAGSLTKTQDGVEGIFQMPDGVYHLLTRNGVGWIADEATLISASEQAFTRLDAN
ncbi:hypothetical protein GCE9029_00262 [Grimontia celer]|uniref:Uncharacterized protein n=1 Tax=Grimontia celer TaxID=1796497 RepID=A0A128ETK8_9GAMM|nr:hypothetical protein [Grimontia celer]CZF77530.1 hypothetical protein GCE9029_00262 [Grimontia celer]